MASFEGQGVNAKKPEKEEATVVSGNNRRMSPDSLLIAQTLTQSATRLQDLVNTLNRNAPESEQRAALRAQVDEEIVTMKRTMQMLRAALDGTAPRASH